MQKIDEQTPLESFVPPWEQVTTGQRLIQFFHQTRQLILLVVLVVIAWVLWIQVRKHSRFPAFARQDLHTIGAPLIGRLESIHVQKGDKVKKGQLLAKMGVKQLKTEYDIAALEKKRLEQLLVSTALQFQFSQVALQTRLASFASQASTTLLSERARFRSSRAELKVLRKELAWQKKIRDQQFGRSNVLGSVEAREKSLSTLMKAMPSLLRLYRQKKRTARRLSKRAKISKKQTKEHIEKLLKPIQSQWAMQVLRIKKLALQLERMELRAPASGYIIEVLHHEGTTLTQGAPVIKMVKENKGLIQAYVDESLARKMKVGMTAQLNLRFPDKTKAGGWFRSPYVHCAKVTATGAIEAMPLRFRSVPQKPVYVRPVMIKLLTPTALIPGELIYVEFSPSACKASTKTHKKKGKKV